MSTPYQPEHDIFQVFDREKDPAENYDIAKKPGTWKKKIKTMSTQLRALRDKDILLASNLPPAEYIVLEDEDAHSDALCALGYVDCAP